MRTRIRAAMLVLLLLPLPAFAGAVFEMEMTDHTKSPPQVRQVSTLVQGKDLKMELSEAQGPAKSGMIFHGERQEIVVLDHGDKQYLVLDKAALQSLAGTVDAAMQQLDSMLQNLPPEQRAQMEQMMKGKLGQAGKSEGEQPELKATGETKSIDGHACRKFEVLREGRKVREMWVTDWSNVEGGAEAIEAFEAVGAFFQELLDSMPNLGKAMGGQALLDSSDLQYMQELNGVPLVSTELGRDGAVTVETRLRSSKRSSVEAAAFEPPAGYTKQEMPELN